jgi:MFS family permease
VLQQPITEDAPSLEAHDPRGKRIAGIPLQRDVKRRHVLFVWLGAFLTLGLLVFESLGTPYILSENLKLPTDAQGTALGTLTLWVQVGYLLAFLPVGILADTWGRRQVYALGFVSLALGYLLSPLASSLGELILYRCFYAFGVAMITGMMTTIYADYAREESRGRMVAIGGVLNGIGVTLCAILLGRLPLMFKEGGASPLEAGQFAHWTVAAICIGAAIALFLGLKPGRGTAHDHPELSARALFRIGFAEGRKPRIALAYASGLIAQGNLVLVGSFLTLWASTAAQDAGMETAEAVSAARIPFVVSQMSALVAAGIAIFALDRVPRVTGVALTCAIASVGYAAMMLIDDPLGRDALPFCALLGLGQIFTILSTTALIAKEAPPNARGAVIGMQNVVGAFGTILIAQLAGVLFDTVSPASPFVMVAVLNAIVFVWALAVQAKHPAADERRR